MPVAITSTDSAGGESHRCSASGCRVAHAAAEATMGLLMAFGIDTFRSHIDLIVWTAFQTWNGATPAADGTQVGGLPLFAGRNFLGGNFIWGHSEATNSSSEPDPGPGNPGPRYPLPAGTPSPDHPENLTLFVDHIAPIQAREDHKTSPQIVTSRQQILGDKGRLLGRIDADALCKRIKAGILAGEFQAGQFVFVWLDVDPGLDFSADYWAGWSDTVNNSMLPIISQGSTLRRRGFSSPACCAATRLELTDDFSRTLT